MAWLIERVFISLFILILKYKWRVYQHLILSLWQQLSYKNVFLRSVTQQSAGVKISWYVIYRMTHILLFWMQMFAAPPRPREFWSQSGSVCSDPSEGRNKLCRILNALIRLSHRQQLDSTRFWDHKGCGLPVKTCLLLRFRGDSPTGAVTQKTGSRWELSETKSACC